MNPLSGRCWWRGVCSLAGRPSLWPWTRTGQDRQAPSFSSSSGSPAAGGKETSAGDTTHFGFQTVSPEQKAEKVQHVFSNVAAKYDLMNDVMSAGIHRYWKDHFVHRLDPVPGCRYLDVAGGTGDIAFRILNHIHRHDGLRESGASGRSPDGTHVTICDINANMLNEGEKRFRNQVPDADGEAIKFVIGDAMKLPFPDNSFDVYTIAFGIRNVVHIDAALREAMRVLKPGGMFSCLEFSRVQNPLLEKVYDWYSFNLIPVYGEVLAGDWKSYQYLVESIRKFPDQEDFKDMIMDSGFKLVHYENLTNGIACIHTGYKE